MSKSKPELKLVEDTGSQLQEEDLGIELPPQQSEMPFAVVEGEPVTQLPRDLYIPPDALQVFLTAFEGPLDLLLYLIRKQNLDILNIPIAEITRQYMQYIEVMAEMQLELAGEYLLMAAMLAEIKSRMLLPRPPVAEGQDEEDPRAELVRRLQEYERFKKAAEDLDRLNRLERDNITASAELEERKVVKLLPDVTLKEMLDAFRDVLSRAEKFAHHHISRERLSQRERMSEILVRLQTVAFFEFRELFKPEEGRMGVTVTFIAILELMKEGLIEIVQAEAYAPIHVRTAQRHLKVVQGGVAASESADAENAAALAQPELAGENDIPDEDETPPADDAAIAVQAAVADVAAASSIAVDTVESGDAIADAGFVEAAVSEAIASTENAVETVAEVATLEEAAVGETVAEVEVTEEAAVEETGAEVAVTDEAAVEETVAEVAVTEEAAVEETGAEVAVTDEAAVEETVGEVAVIEEAAVEETVAEVAVTEEAAVEGLVAEVAMTEEAAVEEAVAEVAIADESIIAAAVAEELAADEPLAIDEALNSHVVDEVTLEDVPHEFGSDDDANAFVDPLEAQAVEYAADAGESAEAIETFESTEAVESAQTVESVGTIEPAETSAAVHEIAAADPGESHTVEEHVVEEHEVEEHVVEEHVVEEHVVPEPAEEENSSQVAAYEPQLKAEEVSEEAVAPAVEAAVQLESAESADQPVTQVENEELAAASTDEYAAVETTEIAAERVEASDVQATHAVEHAAPVEATDLVIENAAAIEAIEVVAETETAVESMKVDAEHAPSSEFEEVVAEAAPIETIEVAADDTSAAIESDEVAADAAPVEETTDVVDAASAPAEQDETMSEQNADLSEPDLSKAGDSVTGAGSSDDNSDAEPSR